MEDFFPIKNYLCTECVVWHPQFYFIRTSRPDVRRFVINDICHEKCRFLKKIILKIPDCQKKIKYLYLCGIRDRNLAPTTINKATPGGARTRVRGDATRHLKGPLT